MVQRTIAVSNRAGFVISITWIFATMVSNNNVNGFHFSTVIAAKVSNKFRLKKFIGRDTRSVPLPETTQPTPIIKEEIQIETESTTNQSNDAIKLDIAEKKIIQYLSSLDNNITRKRKGVGKFHLYGWRWHNMSLIRETERLCRLAQRFQKLSLSQSLDKDQIENLRKAIDYVLNFNLTGMTRVENEVMIPFLRQQFNEQQDDDMKEAFNTVIDHLEMEQQNLSELGHLLTSKIQESKATAAESELKDSIIMNDIIEKSNEIIFLANRMLERKNTIIIPAIVQLVPERKQQSVISRIMSSLGVLDSRLHLVGFHEAIKNNENEFRLWNENIPLVARKVIPIWKQTQYNPRTFALQEM